MLGMRIALHRPERLAAMVLLDTSADGTLFRERIEYRAMCAITRRIGLPPYLLRKKIVPLMFAERTRESAPDLVEEFVRTLGGYPREGLTLAATAVSIDRLSILERLRQIDVPTLVGYGDEDIATPPEHSRRIASRIAGSRLVPFKGAAHLSALEAPALVNDAVVPFVREHMARS
jgi:3-oxoadipate enol-lactonase